MTRIPTAPSNPGPIAPQRVQRIRRILGALESRRRASTSLYEPLPSQLRFHQSNAPERLVRGCIAGEQTIYDPVRDEHRRVDSIDGDFHVLARTEDGRTVVAPACRPFIKGRDDLYRVTLTNGEQFTSTLGHRVLTTAGFVSVSEAYERQLGCVLGLRETSLESCRQASHEDDRRSTRTLAGSPADCRSGRRLCDERLPLATIDGRASSRLQGDVHERSRYLLRTGGLASKQGYIRLCQCAARRSSLDVSYLASDLCDGWQSRVCDRPCQSTVPCQSPGGFEYLDKSGHLFHTTRAFARSATDKAGFLREFSLTLSQEQLHARKRLNSRSGWQFLDTLLRFCTERRLPPCRSAADDLPRPHFSGQSKPSPVDSQASRQLQAEKGRCGRGEQSPHDRTCESVAYVVSLEFVRFDEFYDLTVPVHHNYMLDSIQSTVHHNSNQAGKSLCGVMEVAWAATGCHPYLDYPARDGKIYIVGKDEQHLADPLYEKLFRPGAFEIIRDEVTNEWRAYRPWTDEHRKHERRDADPLIPERMIESISWRLKKSNTPKTIILKNGWRLYFYPSSGKPKQGTQIHLCLAGWSEIYDPVAGKRRRVDSIGGDFHVYSYNDRAGRVEVRRATKPFVKGHGELVRVELSDGRTMFTTRQHRIMGVDGCWVSVQEALDFGTPLALADRLSSRCHDDEALAEHLREKCRTYEQAASSTLLRTAVSTHREEASGTSSPWSGRCCGDECVRQGSETTQDCLDDCSSYRRQCDGRFQPLTRSGRSSVPSQECVPLQSRALSFLGDLGGERRYIRSEFESDVSSVFSLLALADPLQHWHWPVLALGELAHTKHQFLDLFPESSFFDHGTWMQQGQRPGIACCLDRDHERISQTQRSTDECNERLFGSDASCIRCSGSHWHTFAESRHFQDSCETEDVSGGDIFRSFEIPHGFCDGVYVSNITPVCNGEIWDIGVPGTENYVYENTISHNCLFDEEVIDLSWKSEVDLRLMRYGGRFVWAATPHTSSQGLLDLHDRAELEIDKPTPAVTEHRLLIKDNPHIPEEHKQAMIAKITSPDEYLIRVEGEFATAGFLVYPEFNMKTHGCASFDIPKNWTRYMVVDPGYQTACALFFAVPPPEQEFPQHVYLFDEIYANNCDANRFAELCSSKIKDDVYYEFVIDSRAARITPMGGGLTIGQQYEKAFAKFDVQSLRTKSGFVPGVDDVKSGNLAVHDWLYIRPQEGTPKLQVFAGRVPNFEHEIKRYRKKQDKTNKAYLDDPQQKNNHAMDALRYARGRDFKWHRCPAKLNKGDSLYQRFKKAMEAKKDPDHHSYINLGPGNAA